MSDANWTASDLRKALVKKASNGKIGADPAILSAPTKKTALALQNYVMYYNADDPQNPDDIEDDAMYQLLFSRLEVVTSWESTRSGDVSSMRGIAGSQYDDGAIDTSSWKAADVLTGDLWKPNDRDNMLNLILYGPTPSIADGSNTGTGKSDFAYEVSDAGVRAYLKVGKTLQRASNNDTDPFKQVEKWSEAEEWMQDTDGPKLLILDEAAQGLKNKDMTAGDVLGKAIRLMRKYNCHLILISHTGKDIPLDIRRQVVFARKNDKKSATLGNKLEEDASGELMIKNVEYELENIPPTDVEYDSYDDKGQFEWDIDEEDSDEGSVEAVPQCQATTKEDEPCPNDAKMPKENPVVCKSHRNKLKDFDTNSSESDCKVCSSSVGVKNGFCVNHDETDLE